MNAFSPAYISQLKPLPKQATRPIGELNPPRPRDRRMNVYRCPHCEGWHLGEHVRRSIKKERAA